ncbi:MAG: Do family serine endopeptidase [Planctomycetota bacterium]|jgi:C-terminal processing protease CtpA/Prc
MRSVCLTLGLLCGACSSPLPTEPPPLENLVEPPAFLQEPLDEPARLELDAGAFSGLIVTDARETLAALVGEPEGLKVVEVVENSPADFAGLEPDDLLFEADGGKGWIELAYPSDWRGIGLGADPETTVRVLVDRAGAEFEASLTLERRLRPAERTPTRRYTEDEAVGIVIRTATEVEARLVTLSPGAGVVLVGMAASSPWRAVDLVYGDLLTHVDDEPIRDPEVLLNAIRREQDQRALEIRRVRAGVEKVVTAPLSSRERAVREVRIPLVYSYEREPRQRQWSALLGLVRYSATDTAWRMRLLWLLSFGAGDLDRLEEVDG